MGIINFLPQLLSAEDVSGAEESDAGESQVLVQHEHAYGDEVGVTQVVDEAADVAVVPGIDTIHLPVLYRSHRRCKNPSDRLDKNKEILRSHIST